jgi:hypothetical protein
VVWVPPVRLERGIRAKDLKNARAGREGKGRIRQGRDGMGLRYDWEWEDRKCGEGMLLG